MGVTPTVVVLNPALDYALVDLDTVKSELKIQPDNTDEDDWLTLTIGQVSRSIRNYCNRVFQIETVRETAHIQWQPGYCQPAYARRLSGDQHIMQLSRVPIVSVSDVTQGTGASARVLVVNTDYLIDGEAGQLLRVSSAGGSFIAWEQIPVTVTYSAGYETTPEDVVMAALCWMRWRRSQRGSDPMIRETMQPGVSQTTFFAGGIPMAGSVPQEVAALLSEYRPPLVG